MVGWLLSLVGGVVFTAAVHLVRDWLARRRRAAAAGDVVTVPCRRRFSGQRRFRGGRLLVGVGRVLCQGGWGRRGCGRDLGGASLLRIRSVVDGDRSGNQDLVLMFDLGDTLLEIALAERDLDTVTGPATGAVPAGTASGAADGIVTGTASGDGDPDGGLPAGGRAPASRVPLFSAVLLLLAMLVAGGYLYLYLSGTRVEARVLAGPDDAGSCHVGWPDPRTRALRQAALDCAGSTRPGGRVPALALRWPFEGRAFDTYDTPAEVAVLLGGLLSAAGAGIGWRALVSPWMRRRAERDLWAGVARPTPAEWSAPELFAERPGPLGQHELVYRRIADTMRERARIERWSDERVRRFRPRRPVRPSPPDGWGRWWQVPALRRAASGAVGAKITVLLLVVPLLFWVVPWVRTDWLLHHGRVRTAVATVTGGDEIDRIPFWPHDVEVSFRGPRGAVDTTVAGRRIPHGRVTVRYLVADPAAARLAGRDDRLAWGLEFGGTIVTLGLGWTAVVVALALVRVRRVWTALRSPGTPAHYVLADRKRHV